MARVQTKERLPSDEETLTGIPSPDSVADSPCLKPSLSNGHCQREATTFTFPVEGDQKGVPEVKMWNPMTRRTRLERRLIILAVLLVVCSAAMVVILFIQGYSGSEECPRVCTTANCVKSASQLISNMDPTVDPCDDFYKYACGGWHRSNIIPEDEASYAIPSQLVKNLEIQCKDIIERPPKMIEPVAITKARNFYKACMDEDALTDIGHQPLRALIRYLHGWPVLEDGSFDASSWRLADVLAKARLKTDRNFIFANRIVMDPTDSTRYIDSIDQPKLGLENRDYFLQSYSPAGLKAYEEFMVDMAFELRGGTDKDDIRSQMQDVLKFETKMANISLSAAEHRIARTKSYKKTVAQLKKEVPIIDWDRYYHLVMNTTHVNDSMELVIFSPPYVAGLQRILSETPNRTIANYVMWRTVMRTVDQMSNRARSIKHAFQKVVTGEQKQPARWKQCIHSTNLFMGRALGVLFIQDHFDEESKNTAFEMIKHLRKTLYQILNSTEWMDEDTKQFAIEKAHAVREQIGYDEKLLNYTYLDSMYVNIDIRTDVHFDNALQVWSDHARRSFAKLNDSVDRYGWSTTPVVVNAYYFYQSNQITFPAAILQPPYFSREYSRSMNYGGIGVVIGHELTHGFDDRGRHFDKDGNIQLWWSESASRSFVNKTSCLVEQYSNYTYEDLGMNASEWETDAWRKHRRQWRFKGSVHGLQTLR
ncbi:neprilysin-like [Diadema antillarum]|uniref:neprilysin-like n=1 Tax=Diadema antillarum TaxID=105358 RepID=UPI003A86CB78